MINDKSDDRRVRKTKKALKEGLAILMKEKNIKDISVRELTELVDLNRGTFYLHYSDVYELKQQLENDIISEITSIFNKHLPGKTGSRPYQLFITLLSYIQDNATLCKMLLSSNSGRSFLDKLSDFIEMQFMQNLSENMQKKSGSLELTYFSGFVVSGYISIISRWLELDMKPSLEELALMMEQMGMYGIGFLDESKLACDNNRKVNGKI